MLRITLQESNYTARNLSLSRKSSDETKDANCGRLVFSLASETGMSASLVIVVREADAEGEAHNDRTGN